MLITVFLMFQRHSFVWCLYLQSDLSYRVPVNWAIHIIYIPVSKKMESRFCWINLLFNVICNNQCYTILFICKILCLKLWKGIFFLSCFHTPVDLASWEQNLSKVLSSAVETEAQQDVERVKEQESTETSKQRVLTIGCVGKSLEKIVLVSAHFRNKMSCKKYKY